MRWLVPSLVVSGLVVASCVSAAPPAIEPDQVQVQGALYLDLHVDSPCDTSEAPAELAGVTLTFRSPDGATAQTQTGPIGYQLLQFGDGKSGWRYPGCRYFSSYEIVLPHAESYSVTFEDADPANDDGVGFVGISQIGEHEISFRDLESSSFAWDFEVEPEYVPSH